MREALTTPLNYFIRVSALLVAMALVGVTATASGAAEGNTTLVSVDSSGNQANGESYGSISSDGRFVVFVSRASNLVPNDTNDRQDVFLRDLQTGTTERVSVDSSGNQTNSESYDPSISPDGRFVAYYSYASSLVANDTNNIRDVFLHDRQSGATQRVSVDSSGNQANKRSVWPSVSSDGRFVAFESEASNLVANDINDRTDVFVYDRQTETTELVSVDSSGNQANGRNRDPSISADGRFVAFESHASNLVPNDTNSEWDVFVHDHQTGNTERVSVNSSGEQAHGEDFSPFISSGGRFVAYYSYASDLVPNDTNGRGDAFVHDRQTGTTQRVSLDSSGKQVGRGGSGPSISSDGRFVVFSSGASNLVPNDTNGFQDVFVHERDTTAPKVRRVVPTGGATGVALKANVVVTFSEKMMAKGTLTKANFRLYKLIKKADGTTTARQIENVTVTPSSDGLKATLDPYGNTDGLLAKDTRYKVVVDTGALDVFGNPLDQNQSISGKQPKVWHFMTRG